MTVVSGKELAVCLRAENDMEGNQRHRVGVLTSICFQLHKDVLTSCILEAKLLETVENTDYNNSILVKSCSAIYSLE